MVAMNETFLTQAIGDAGLADYDTIMRRDRIDQWGGGIMLCVLKQYSKRVTLVEKSDAAERAWAVLHSDQGPYLFGIWYRPPAPGDTSTIDTLESEWRRHSSTVLGTILIGDINVHSIRWLTHSAKETREGAAMHDTANRMGLRQIVRAPTRGPYLLDLVLSDVKDITAKPLKAMIADHQIVFTTMRMSIPQAIEHERSLWHFSSADWSRLARDLQVEVWNLDCGANENAKIFTNRILELARESIPHKAGKVREC